ncbi:MULTISPECIES: substrate-binding domain-containing protein [unclassified Cobetia]|uniref:substrate-binding domain-containing protein n=1 Tax=unclassified Cobetia TaxID=2609414 RepID=UPI002097E395|nr:MULTISPECIES: substrate-binding domain-containing protein [unclassified Cobetia]MCO7233563.1 substrate-binding domain-containing protein [Cobetia sp. Dlab-2-AX]MCO7236839.1 substrate-binding domain-containing protein [Cobetia sp. Dlab-2-U]
MNRPLKQLAFVIASAAVVSSAQARDQVRIVGSSTVYPFSSYVAEEFGVTTDHPTPVIEATGSGGGMKLFCEGVGSNTPNITNASRRMKASEFERCQENGVTDITEAFIGYDGIAFAQSNTNDAAAFTLEQIALAVAAQVPVDGKLVANPYTRWNQIDPSLPDRKITIYGPPSTSGTRDSFEELVLEAATEEMDGYGGEGYSKVRNDGVFVPAGENDNLIVQKLSEDTEAFGVFGYSFLEENEDSLSGATIDGIAPSPEAISEETYPVARTMFFYIKNQHAEEAPVMYDYADLFMSEKMVGNLGYLKGIGLIPAHEEARKAARQAVADRKTLTLSDLKG